MLSAGPLTEPVDYRRTVLHLCVGDVEIEREVLGARGHREPQHVVGRRIVGHQWQRVDCEALGLGRYSVVQLGARISGDDHRPRRAVEFPGGIYVDSLENVYAVWGHCQDDFGHGSRPRHEPLLGIEVDSSLVRSDRLIRSP